MGKIIGIDLGTTNSCSGSAQGLVPFPINSAFRLKLAINTHATGMMIEIVITISAM